MPAAPSFILQPVWSQFAALIPERADTHPRGCHRPRIADRIVFDKLVQVLVLGCSYATIADPTCSATTIRARRDEWIIAGIFTRLEDLCLDTYDRIIGLDLTSITIDGCLTKAPCGGQAAGKSPVHRGKQDTKRSVMVDAAGIPLGCVVAPANRNDSILLEPTLEHRARFDHGLGCGLPDRITVHLDAGYDSLIIRQRLTTLGCDWVISARGTPLQVGARWVVERTNAWHNRGFGKLRCCTERHTQVIEAFIALANTIIITRRLVRQARITHRWDTRPTRRP